MNSSAPTISLLPDSLVGRMTVLSVAIGLLSLLLHLLTVTLWVQPLAMDFASVQGNRAHAVRDLLAAADAAARDAVAQRMSNGRSRVLRGHAGGAAVTAPPLLPQRFVNQLREDAGPDIVVSMGTQEVPEKRRLLRFEFDVAGEPWRIDHEVDPPVEALLGTGLGWLALMALAVAATLVLGARFIARPMSRVTAEIAALGSHLRTLAPPRGASSELRMLVDSFNALVDEVRRADETKQHLLAGVSHDLRTPLARLRLRIETQCDEPLARQFETDLHAIERIVSQFLAFVQGDRRVAVGEPEPLAQLVRQVVAGYQTQRRAVRAVVDDVPLLASDLALQRALTNLIDNALTHGRGPVEVTLARRASHAAAHEGNAVALTVWDRGEGMTPDEFRQAQQPFVRLGSSASTLLGHCGLGLAIVTQIARHLGASLESIQDGERFGIALVWSEQSAPAQR
jgi:two-component system, OmpR family, osmolarity sensor histidine kinase EnvZ